MCRLEVTSQNVCFADPAVGKEAISRLGVRPILADQRNALSHRAPNLLQELAESAAKPGVLKFASTNLSINRASVRVRLRYHLANAPSDANLALAARPPYILILERGDRSHAAVLRFTAQPAKKGALKQLGVEAIRLRPSVLVRHRDTRWVDDVSLELSVMQPARRSCRDRPRRRRRSACASSLRCLLPPTIQKLQ